MNYPSIRIEGAILSADILERLEDAAGQKPGDFGFEPSAKVKDEIARAWADAQDYWRIYQRKLETLKTDAPATTETRNLWTVPFLGLLGYQLEYQPKSIELNGKSYALSHRAINRGQLVVHVIGSREPAGLDRKPERAALRMSAHAMVQEYLNLSDQLYGIVTNGHLLRLLRDSSRLVKLTYLEFDLDRIFGDGLFADFAILYRLLHVTRLPQSADVSSTCLLEKYHQETIEQGSRIREGLRISVTETLQELGTGFLAHPDNFDLRQKVASGELSPSAYFNFLLRLIYRLLFLMVIEERGMVFPKGTLSKKIAIYVQHYSVQRLRRLATTRGLKDVRYYDAWLQLLATFHLFENPTGAAVLGTTVLGGQLFGTTSLGPLSNCRISNAALFASLEQLCYFRHPQSGQRMPVNFGALATEEFGSVYESLLELHPVCVAEPAPFFSFRQVAGNERKTSGSYYTPSSLVDCLLDSTLDPLLEQAEKETDPDKAMLALKVCDPACGSGHFLIAAAQRIAKRLAWIRAGDEEPAPELLHHTLRDVIGHCIFGVDINPMSVELCKVGLWLEAVEPGKPLNFLDHHIKCGNSLLGATPAVIREGIPDKAYDPIVGDNKDAAKWMKKLNQKEREGQTRFDFESALPWDRLGNFPAAVAKLEQLDDDTPESLSAKEEHYRQIVESSGYDNARLLHDAWCAAFVWPKVSTDYGTELTTEHLRKIEHNPHSVAPHLKEQIRTFARQFRFFHWHLEFPAVFGANGGGGFDCILGNPPWERVNIEARQFFASTRPDIAEAITSKRRKLLDELEQLEPQLFHQFQEAQRHAAVEISFFQNSGLYPHLNQARLNTYVLFVELVTTLSHGNGRCGLIVPSGIATDEISRHLFAFLVKSGRLESLFDFENRLDLFPSVDSRMKFCLLTLRGGESRTSARLAFFLQKPEEINHAERVYTLSVKDFELISPMSGLCPTFRTGRDRQIVLKLYEHILPYISQQKDKKDWLSSDYLIMFRSDDSTHLYKSFEELDLQEPTVFSMPRLQVVDKVFVPVWEAKLIHQFDHRFATFSGVSTGERKKGHTREIEETEQDAWIALPRYWAPLESVQSLLMARGWNHQWLCGYRDITNATNERTAIASCLPEGGAAQPLNIFLPESSLHACFWIAAMNSFPLDYVARQRIGGVHLNITTCRQLPLIGPKSVSDEWKDFIRTRALELVFTSPALEPFARDCGFDGPPFRWNEARRIQIRCELDAAFFHLYGIERNDVDYIMNTFPIVKRKDETKHGSYRTKETILALYDALSEAQRTGQPFVSSLNPPPADPRCCHPPKGIDFKSPVQIDYAVLPDGAWARPFTDNVNEAGAIMAAVLKAIGGPAPARQVRLAAILASEPRLFTPALAGEEAILWRRLIGKEAEPLSHNVASFTPRTDRAWGSAVQHLRSRGMLIENSLSGTWAPGAGLDAIDTEGWPDGRAQMVLSVLSRRNSDELTSQLPDEIRRWIDEKAA